MAPATVEANLESALAALVGTADHPGRGAFLMEIDANERSLSHHLAICLAARFPGWDVDCEYNRDGIDDPKCLHLPQRTEPTSTDVDAKTVFPDIIVHHRGLGGAQNNLLVVEIKKSSNKHDFEFEFDRVKLREFQLQLGYQNAYLVVIDTDHSRPAPFAIERIPPDYVGG